MPEKNPNYPYPELLGCNIGYGPNFCANNGCFFIDQFHYEFNQTKTEVEKAELRAKIMQEASRSNCKSFLQLLDEINSSKKG